MRYLYLYQLIIDDIKMKNIAFEATKVAFVILLLV